MSLLCPACIEEYFPDDEGQSGKIIIDAILSDREGEQSVRVSRSSSISSPSFDAVEGCSVDVLDEDGNLFHYQVSNDPGIYRRTYAPGELETGKTYALRVVTSDGEEYMSDYETMLAAEPIDTIYYREEGLASLDDDFTTEGVRFYVDIKASEDKEKYFAYIVNETWEAYTPYKIAYIYDSAEVLTPYDNLAGVSHCWMNKTIDRMYVAGAEDNNGLKGIPLHYVNTYTSKLKYKYSLLLYQLSISQEVYEYYEALNKQSFESGGIYDTQPRKLYGNICNSHVPEEEVLGFFVVSSVSTRRIFVEENFEFRFHDYNYCSQSTATLWQFYYMTSLWPIYLSGYNPETRDYYYGEKSCFDCTLSGGSTERPSYWDED